MNLTINQQKRIGILEHIFPFAHGDRMIFFFFVLQLKQHTFQLFIMPMHIANQSLLLSFKRQCFFAYLHSTYQVFKNKILSYSISISSKCLVIMEETELLNKYINSFVCEFPICILLSQFPYQVKLKLSDEILRYKVRVIN